MENSASCRVTGLVAQSHRYLDPLLPDVPMIPGLRCLDHTTFVAPAAREAAFRDYWVARGLHPMEAITPDQYPARHIAFAEAPGATAVCEDMVGLSVSEDPASPVNRLIEMYGGQRVDERGELAVGRLQHVALAVGDEFKMGHIRDALTYRGVRFMTPILTFADGNGASLQQMFVACKVPYGPFVEIIKRGPGSHGEPFQGFNADQIDALYKHYDAHSRMLCRGTVA